MWHERAAYGHFFYRIPNGESAADAYDRVSGFNESLYRQFEEDGFPSVLVLVTHGLMARVWLMKWFHWSVEYFEDLRNVEHCGFVVLEKCENGKYELKTEMRTWTGRGRERQEKGRYACPPPGGVEGVKAMGVGERVGRKWGGCAGGCTHEPYTEVREEEAEVERGKGRDFGGSRSGAGSREVSDDEAERLVENKAGGELWGASPELPLGVLLHAGPRRRSCTP